MKIVRISGQNIASIEDPFEINFTEEPLASAGLFAIIGPTGSGKSTILDALCLALYNRTPRISLKVDEEKIIDVGENVVSQTRPSTLLRKGAKSGWCEVEFIALNSKRYRSKWSISRAYSKATGRLQDEQIELYNLTDDKQEQGTKSKLLNQISEIIGLTFEQFTRTVLLAQGDFANFLRAKSSDKAQLLEKLTGTEIYARISTSIYEHYQTEKIKLDKLKDNIANITLLTEEELALIDISIKELQEQRNQNQKSVEQVNKQLDWFLQYTNNEKELHTLKEGVDQINQRLALLASDEKQISDYRSTEEVRPLLYNFNRLVKELSNVSDDINTKTVTLKKIESELTTCIRDYETAQNELKKINERYTTLRPKIAESRQYITQSQEEAKEIVKQENKANEIKQLLKVISDKTAQLRQELTAKERDQKQMTEWCQQHTFWQALIDQLSYLLQLIDNSWHTKQESESYKRQLQQAHKLITTYTKEIENSEKQLDLLKQLPTLEVAKLRGELTPGKACPVCGSFDHPYKHEDYKEDDLLEINEQKRQIEELSKAILAVQKILDDSKREAARLETTIENNTKQYHSNYNTLTELLTSHLSDWESSFHKKTLREELINGCKKFQSYSNDILDIKNKVVLIEAEIKQQLTRKEDLEESLKSIEADIKHRKALIQEYKEEVEKRLADKTPDQIEELFNKYVNEREKTLKDNQKLVDEKRIIKSQLEGKLDSARKELSRLEKEKEMDNQSIVLWIENNPQFDRQQLEEIILWDLNTINRKQKEIELEKQAKLRNETLLEQKTREQQKHLTSTLRIEEEQKIELEHLQKASIERENVLNKELIENQAKITAHKENAKKSQDILAKINKQTITTEHWAQLNSLLGQQNGGKFKNIAQQYTLDTLLYYSNHHLRTLAPRYLLQRIPESLSLQVVDQEMLNEIRSVISLSGGETFLISLALALGLSSLSSNRMKVESLFIDEGFGSLDPQTLTIAIEALEQLQLQGRKIGIISHVAEMNERITTRIEVQPISGGKSQIVITG